MNSAAEIRVLPLQLQCSKKSLREIKLMEVRLEAGADWSCSIRWCWGGDEPLLALRSPCMGTRPHSCPTSRRCLWGAHFFPMAMAPEPHWEPSAGLGWEHGRSRRLWREGQTGGPGKGLPPTLVNIVWPCILFKALNRGWDLSSPDVGPGGG